MKLNACETLLTVHVPLMRCGNRAEFTQRLQWLSEGMLRNHLYHVVDYRPDPIEMAQYRQYKEAQREVPPPLV